jgi:hypothetical protein
MMKASICIGICLCMMGCMFSVKPISGGNGQNPPMSELDQSFTPNNYNPTPLNDPLTGYAQSFTPTKEVLTWASLLLSKNNYPSYALIRLKYYRQLTEGGWYIVDQAIVHGSDLPETGYGWINFTFENTPLISGDEHSYLSLEPDVKSENQHIICWYSTGNPYNRGSYWKHDDTFTWYQYPDQDFIFKTYGEMDSNNPILQISPTTINLGDVHKNEWKNNTVLTVSNGGTGLLYWEIDPLTISSSYVFSQQYGFLSGFGNSTSFYVDIFTPSQKGSYDIPITFLSNGGTVELHITCTVAYADQSCFLAGTKITMADGSYKNIEEIRAGDLVESYDFGNNKIVTSNVIDVTHHDRTDDMANVYVVINGDLQVTPNHPILVNGKWMKAGTIKTGDTLVKIDKTKTLPLMIQSTQAIYKNVPTYNIIVENQHCYLANNILVSDKMISISAQQINNFER